MRANLDGTNPPCNSPQGQDQPQEDRGRRQLRVLVPILGGQDCESSGPTWWTAPTRRSSSPAPRGAQLTLALLQPRRGLGFTPSPYDFGEAPAGEAAKPERSPWPTRARLATSPLTVTPEKAQAAFTTTGDTCTGTSLRHGRSPARSRWSFGPTSFGARHRHPDRGQPGPLLYPAPPPPPRSQVPGWATSTRMFNPTGGGRHRRLGQHGQPRRLRPAGVVLG